MNKIVYLTKRDADIHNEIIQFWMISSSKADFESIMELRCRDYMIPFSILTKTRNRFHLSSKLVEWFDSQYFGRHSGTYYLKPKESYASLEEMLQTVSRDLRQ